MTSANIVDELKQQGNKAFSSGQFESAIDLFSQAINNDASNHVLYSNRSAAFASLKQYEKALEDAEKATELAPDWSKGYSRKGAALFGLGRYKDAEVVYQKGLQFESSNAALKKGLEDAKAAQTASSSAAGGNPFASMFEGDYLSKLASNPQTAPLLSDRDLMAKLQMCKQNPQMLMQYMNDPRMMQVLGALLGINISTADSMPQDMPMDTTADVDPEEVKIPKEKVKEEVKKEAEAEAELDLDAVEEKKQKEMSKAEKELGNASYKKKEFQTALDHYAKAWELDNSDITILTNRAAVFYEMSEFDKCIETCDEAVERGREIRADFKIIAKAFARMGNAHLKKEDLDSAIKFYQKSLSEHRTPDVLAKLRETEKLKEQKIKESYQDPVKAEEERNKGNELFKAAKFAEAIQHYNESIKRAESDPRGYSNRAACYTKLMALPDALRDAEKAISLDATFVKAYIRKAAVQFAMKEYVKCVQTCEEALLVDQSHHENKHKAEIEGQKQKAQAAMYGYGAASSGSDGEMSQEEKAKKAMQDPKIQEIMADPVMRQILEQMSTDPAAARDHMKNPIVREKIQLLINAGIIGVR